MGVACKAISQSKLQKVGQLGRSILHSLGALIQQIYPKDHKASVVFDTEHVLSLSKDGHEYPLKILKACLKMLVRGTQCLLNVTATVQLLYEHIV